MESKLTQVTPDVLLNALEACAIARLPAFTWGHPGIGKSDVHRQLAKRLSAFLIDVRASQWDSVDTRGVPYVSEGTTRWAIPDVFPSHQFAKQHEMIIIFLDELNNAPLLVQAALYQLILDRRLGEYTLPDNVVIFAAGNLETDRAAAQRMSSALANRFVHFELMVDARAWERWALRADLHVATIAYMRWKPEHLHDWDPRSASKAQPTPRTWEYASKLVKTLEAQGTNGEIELAMLAGTLGEGVGASFRGFLKIYRDLPDPDAIIMAPLDAVVPSAPEVKWALCGALAERSSKQNFDRVLKYAARLEPEFMTLLVRSATIKTPELQQTRAFIEWASNNSDVLI